MIKFPKDKKVKPTGQSEVHQPVVGEAGFREADPRALAQPFAPMVEQRPTADLIVNARNARTHSARQVEQIAASILKFGFIVPIVVNDKSVVLAGHGRLRAAQQLGLKEVPTIVVKHLTEELQRAFMLADNRLAELAGWDEELLRVELQELSLAIDFEFEVTGFDTVDLDRLEAPKLAKTAKPEVVPELERDRPAISAPGDLWKLDKHLLLCGSALEQNSYQRLMGDERAQMVFTDPPYNVAIDGHVCGLGSVRHQDFGMASGEMTEPEFTGFLNSFMGHAAQHSHDGAIHFICMDWRHMGEVLAAAGKLYELKNVCVWNKTNGGMGTFYRSKHEMVFVFKAGSGPHINNFGLGEKGRYRTNVWDYPGRQHFQARPHGRAARPPDGKAVGLGGGRPEGLLEARCDSARPVRRQRHDPTGGGEDRPPGPRHRARPLLRRRRHRPLAGADRPGSGPCRDAARRSTSWPRRRRMPPTSRDGI